MFSPSINDIVNDLMFFLCTALHINTYNITSDGKLLTSISSSVTYPTLIYHHGCIKMSWRGADGKNSLGDRRRQNR